MSVEYNEPGQTMGKFTTVRPTEAEVLRQLPGDDFPGASVVISSAITLDGTPEEVWPWLLQIGRRDDGRGGWPLPRSVERFMPKESRALRSIDSSIDPLQEGYRFRDWLGKAAMIDVVEMDSPNFMVLAGDRDRGISWKWTLALDQGTRLLSRTRIAGIQDSRFNRTLGSVADRVVAAGLRAGLNERLIESRKGE